MKVPIFSSVWLHKIQLWRVRFRAEAIGIRVCCNESLGILTKPIVAGSINANVARVQNTWLFVCIPVFLHQSPSQKEKKPTKKKWFVGAVLPWSHPTRSRKNHRKITEPSASWWFFTNPSEKYAAVKLDHFPQGSWGENSKNIWVATT